MCPTILLSLCVLVAMRTCLPSRCLAMMGGDTHTDTQSGIYEAYWKDESRCHDIHTKFNRRLVQAFNWGSK
jgi:hypothetical protein